MATPEKAISDTLYYRGRIPASDELELDDIDREILFEAAEKFPSTAKPAWIRPFLINSEI